MKRNLKYIITISLTLIIIVCCVSKILAIENITISAFENRVNTISKDELFKESMSNMIFKFSNAQEVIQPNTEDVENVTNELVNDLNGENDVNVANDTGVADDIEPIVEEYILLTVTFKETNATRQYSIKEDDQKIYVEPITPTISEKKSYVGEDLTAEMIIYICFADMQKDCNYTDAFTYMGVVIGKQEEAVSPNSEGYTKLYSDEDQKNTFKYGIISEKNNDSSLSLTYTLAINKNGKFSEIKEYVEEYAVELERLLDELLEDLENELEKSVKKIPQTGSGYGAKDVVLVSIIVLITIIMGMLIHDVRKN